MQKKPLVAGIALALSMSLITTQAATISVNRNSDLQNSPYCTLRNAIISANTDTVVGDCVAGSGADIIDLGSNSTIDLTQSADLLVTSDITIEGHGQTVRRSPHFAAHRLFRVSDGGANLTINELRLANGNSANVSPCAGGAILMQNGASLTLNRSTIENNSAGFGGAIANLSTGSLSINQSTIRANNASTYGGGLFLSGVNSVEVKYSTISGNSSYIGGGIQLNDGASLTLRNSTLSANTASGNNNGSGGAIFNKSSFVNIDSSTLNDNSADYGGGIYLSATDYTGSISLTNTIIANSINGDCDGGAGAYSDISDHFFASGVNLVEDGTICGFTASVSMLTTDPDLAALADNGGPTLTHALSSVSDAINANGTCPQGLSDQRGYLRPAGQCDLGAFEFGGLAVQSGPDFVVTSSNNINDGFCHPLPGHCSLHEAIDASNANADASTINFANTVVFANPPLIFLNGSPLAVISSEISIQGDGVHITGVGSTRLFEVQSATLTLNQLELTGGHADLGGGIYTNNSQVSLNQTIVRGNSATLRGGGMFIKNSQVDIVDSTFSVNRTNDIGGGLFISDNSSVTISNSTISENTATTESGAIEVSQSSLELIHTTLSHNHTVNGNAGGLVLEYGSTTNISNSILANSTNGSDCWRRSSSTLTTSGANLLESDHLDLCSSIANFTQLGVDPMLTELGNHGGFTETHSPFPGSPVLNAGDNLLIPIDMDSDQRDRPRIFGGTVDLGSVELSSGLLMVNSNIDLLADDGKCTLREALVSVQTQTASGAMPGECGAGEYDENTLDMSSIANSTITLSGTQLPVIEKFINIPGHGVVIDASKQSRVFEIAGLNRDTSLALDNLSLKNGYVSNYDQGGAINASHTWLSLNSVQISGSEASKGGAINGDQLVGLSISDSTFSGNTARLDGGALHLRLYSNSGLRHRISASTISGNHAGRNFGGAYFARSDKLEITNSTISGNTAVDRAGSLYIWSSKLHLNNSTISNNTAGFIGGLYIRNTDVFMSNSVIANNGHDCYTSTTGTGATITTYGNNLVQSVNNCFAIPARAVIGPDSLLGGDPLLGPLADNGGPTQTHLPLTGSPVINAGVNTALPEGVIVDQRGFLRVIDGTVDLGSVEVQPVGDIIFTDGFE